MQLLRKAAQIFGHAFTRRNFMRALLSFIVLTWTAVVCPTSPVQAQRSPQEVAAQTLPKNGHIWRSGAGSAAARFVIETRGSSNYLVRLYEKPNNRLVMTVMVHGGKTVETKAPFGNYTLRYAVGGPQWFGLVELFGPSTEVYEA
jgi:hypothetical protein